MLVYPGIFTMIQFAKVLFQVQVLMTLLAHLGVLGTAHGIAPLGILGVVQAVVIGKIIIFLSSFLISHNQPCLIFYLYIHNFQALLQMLEVFA